MVITLATCFATMEPTPPNGWAHEEQRDGLSTLSPRQRSCINLGNVEPCINKAIELLHTLRKELEGHEKNGTHTESTELPSGGRVSTVMWEDKEGIKKNSDGLMSSPIDDTLCIEGRATGSHKFSTSVATVHVHVREKLEWQKAIEGALDLVIRMEKDRQETIHKLMEEKERVHQLNMKLDQESKRRLDLLESSVQSEHEHSVHELKELRLCVEHERILLAGALYDLSIAAAKNSQLRREEDELLANGHLLKDKITDEKEKIDEIARLQNEASDAVRQSQRIQADTEEKLVIASKKARAEARQRESKLNIARSKVRNARDQLNDTDHKAEAVHAKICKAQANIKESKERTQEYEESAVEKRLELDDIRHQAGDLQEKCSHLTTKKEEIEDHLRCLEADLQKECEVLDKAHEEQKAAVTEAQQALHKAKDRREEMEQDTDRMREEIAACKKQQEDDKKAVERNRKELVRLDQQLKVSKIQFTKIRELNHELSRRLEEEKARTGDKEYTLKGTVETLQKEMRETNSVRTDLEVQVKECTTRHECLTKNVEAMKTKLKNATEQSAAEQQWLNKEVADLESKYKGQKMTAEELTEKLATIKENFDTMTSTLGYEVEELQRTVREQNDELVERSEEYKARRTRIDLLQDKLQEVEKALLSTDKMKKDTQADIDSLLVTVEDHKQRLDNQKEDERSWRQELQDIVDFREDAKSRYLQYTEEREQHLKDVQQSLHSSLAHNASMGEYYSQLQGKYLAVKSKMVEALEGQHCTEATARDLKQLKCVQSQLSSHMKTHLDYRSASYTIQLLSLQIIAKSNYNKLLQLHSDLEYTTVRNVDKIYEQ